MERKIEFRGKSKLNKEWLFGDLLRLGGNRTPCIFSDKDSIRYFNTDNSVVIPETIGQFTGLRDKNGVKIYEGDIIEHTISGNISVHEVYFDNEMLEFGLRYSGELFHCQFNDEFELVGNIHDNPELLNK